MIEEASKEQMDAYCTFRFLTFNEEVSRLGLVNAGTNKNAGKRICGLKLMR